MKKKHSPWLVSPKWFTELIGGEYQLLLAAGGTALLRFYISSAIIGLIFITSVISIFYAVELLFHMVFIEIILSAFISFLFILIYIFLINTFSKDTSRVSPGNKSTTLIERIRSADVVRTAFVILMAFLISKPLEVFIFKDKLNKKTIDYKKILLSEYEERIKNTNVADLNKLQNQHSFFQTQLDKYPSPSLQYSIALINSQIDAIKSKEKNNLAAAEIKIRSSDYFIYRVAWVSRQPVSWLICLGVTILFLLPGFLIYSIPGDDTYFKLKRDKENKLIIQEYKLFKYRYRHFFHAYHKIDIVPYTNFEDPPLNTRRKPKPLFNSQDAFLNRYS